MSFIEVASCAMHLLKEFSDGIDVKGIEAPLLAINPTIAAFSVNFALSGYQASPYRQFYRGISLRQSLASLAVLFASFAPVLCVAIDRSIAAALALVILLPVGISSLALLAVARKETTGETLVRRLTHGRAVLKFLRRAWREARLKRTLVKALPFDPEPGKPIHEIRLSFSPPASRDDPFSDLASLALMALKIEDLATFEIAFERYVRIAQRAIDFKPKHKSDDDYVLCGEVSRIAKSGFDRIVVGCRDLDKAGVFVTASIDRIAESLLTLSTQQKQCEDFAFSLLGELFLLGRKALELGNYEDATKPLTIARQLAYDGIKAVASMTREERILRSHFAYCLGSFATVMQRNGTFAIAQKDSNHLWKVFEALTWLGCYAVKYNVLEPGKQSLRALAQLARESRAANLECHWDKCAVLPWQHVEQKIRDVTSWAAKLDEDLRAPWLELSGAALSRVTGLETDVSMKGTGEETIFEITKSKTPSRLSFSDASSGSRTLDYSDPAMLKDFELLNLNGGRGLIRGAPTPIFPVSKSEQVKS